MPKKLPEGKERHPLTVSMSLDEKNAVRKTVEKTRGITTYGEFLLAVLSGRKFRIPARQTPSGDRSVSIKFFLEAELIEDLAVLAARRDVSIGAYVRASIFGSDLTTQSSDNDAFEGNGPDLRIRLKNSESQALDVVREVVPEFMHLSRHGTGKRMMLEGIERYLEEYAKSAKGKNSPVASKAVK